MLFDENKDVTRKVPWIAVRTPNNAETVSESAPVPLSPHFEYCSICLQEDCSHTTSEIHDRTEACGIVTEVD